MSWFSATRSFSLFTGRLEIRWCHARRDSWTWFIAESVILLCLTCSPTSRGHPGSGSDGGDIPGGINRLIIVLT